MKLSVGDKAPDFTLPNQDGKLIKLSSFKGKKVLVYFYPKDDTPGCTKEACDLRDSIKNFQNLGIVILGVSTDSVESHKKFSVKYKLPFDLLSDEDKKVVTQYGVWGGKSFMGKTHMGTFRSSFFIGPDGMIQSLYKKVNPETHASDVINDAKLS